MTESPDIGPGEVEIFSAADKLDSASVRREVEDLLDSIQAHQTKLATSYVRLGSALAKIQEARYWIGWGYKSWGSYIDFVRGRIGRERSQVYAILSTTQRLLPTISESDLNVVGISKAQELARFVKQSGRRVPDNLLELAKDETTTVERLHAAVLEELHEHGEVRGKWLDLGGFYAGPGEREEIQQAWRAAMGVDPAIDDTLPEHEIRREVYLRQAREFVAAYPEALEEE